MFKNTGVLFENDILQVGIKSDFTDGKGEWTICCWILKHSVTLFDCVDCGHLYSDTVFCLFIYYHRSRWHILWNILEFWNTVLHLHFVFLLSERGQFNLTQCCIYHKLFVCLFTITGTVGIFYGYKTSSQKLNFETLCHFYSLCFCWAWPV